MNQTYDIVVVGAAVSGLSAGISAALAGAETLIVEKGNGIGASIRCGELVPSASQMQELFPRATSISRFFELFSQRTICNTTKTVRVFSPKGRSYEFSFGGLVLNREELERSMAEKAKEEGATVRTSTVVKGVDKEGSVTRILMHGSDGDSVVKTKLLIGADGYPSKIGKWTHLGAKMSAGDCAMCVQGRAYNANVDDDVVEMYLGREYAPGGYAWVIPKGDGAVNVGLGVVRSYLRRGSDIVDLLDAFVQEHPVASKHFLGARFSPMIAKMLPVGGLFPNISGNGTLLTGDAAGTMIAVNGSGIPTAFVAGALAGETASRCLKGQCDLSLYARRLKVEVGRVLRIGYLYRRAGDLFMRSDDVFEKILRAIGTRNVAKVIKCVPPI